MKKKQKLTPLSKSKPYSEFKTHRDTALEKLIHNHLSAIDLIIGKMKSKIMSLITQRYFVDSFRMHGQGPIKQELSFAAVQVSEITKRLRAQAYLLAHAGEAEAIGRALGKATTSTVKVKEHKDKETFTGGDIYDRMFLYFDRLGRDIQDALQMSQVLEEDPKERVLKAFPKTREIKKTPALRKRKTKEADDMGVSPLQWVPKMSVGVTDENLWEEILEDYRSTTLPSDIFKRGPQDKTLYYDVDALEKEERYTWEVEQEITEDFVRSVRSGEQDAAKENGIHDFMWIAVIDAKTDECCFVRDGKSSSQIEDELESGIIDEDECDAIVPPAHFNCRCSAAPMDEDVPEHQEIDYSDFDEWLESKARGE